MWDLDYKESWAPKNWCFWTVVLEKTLESPFDYKEIQPVHPKGDQSWVFTGRTDVEAETESWLICKDPDARKDWGQVEKGTTGWDGWMVSPTQWTWVLVNSRSWWWIEMPGMLRFLGWQRVVCDWVTELNWSIPGLIYYLGSIFPFDFLNDLFIDVSGIAKFLNNIVLLLISSFRPVNICFIYLGAPMLVTCILFTNVSFFWIHPSTCNVYLYFLL